MAKAKAKAKTKAKTKAKARTGGKAKDAEKTKKKGKSKSPSGSKPKLAMKSMSAPPKKKGKKKSGKSQKPARQPDRERKPDIALVEETLAMLAARDRTSAAALREVGAHILDGFFGGDTDAARSNDPSLARSYTLLEERADEECDWDAADLRTAVNAEVVSRSLPVEVALSIDRAYLSRLAAIEDPDARTEVASRIARGELTTQAARDLIAEHARTAGGGPRSSRPAPVRLAGSLERVLSRVEADRELEEEIHEVKPEERPRLLQRLEHVASRLGRFLDRLRHHDPTEPRAN